MPIVAVCPQCEKKVKVPNNLVGKRAKCPGCANVYTIQLADLSQKPAPAEDAAAMPDPPKRPGMGSGAEPASSGQQSARIKGAKESAPVSPTKGKAKQPRSPIIEPAPKRSLVLWTLILFSSLLLVGLILGVVWVAMKSPDNSVQPPLTEGPKPPPPVTEIPNAQWKVFTSDQEMFKVSFPGQPRKAAQSQLERENGVVSYDLLLSSPDMIYSVKCATIPPSDPDKNSLALDEMRAALASDYPGSVMEKDERISLQKHLGRQWTLRKALKGAVIIRTIITNQFLYQLTVTGSVLDANQAAVKKFFDSFTLLEKKPAVPVPVSDDGLPEIGILKNEELNGLLFHALSNDGKLLAFGQLQMVSVWDVVGRKRLTVIKPDLIVQYLSFSGDAQNLFVSDGRIVRVYDSQTGKPGMSLDSSKSMVSDLAVAPDGSLFATLNIDGLVHFWSAKTFQEVKASTRLPAIPRKIAFSPNSQKLALSDFRGSLSIWKVQDWTKENEFKKVGGLTTLTYAASGGLLLMCTLDGEVKIWNADSQQIFSVTDETGQAFNAAALSSDGKIVAASRLDGLVKVWAVGTKKLLAQVQTKQGSVKCLAFFNKDQMLATGGVNSGNIYLFDLSGLKR